MNSQQPVPRKASAIRLPLILLGAAVLLVVALLALRPAPVPQGNLTGSAVGGPFALIDETGRAVTSDSFAGKWRLMYFGFTYCPDICPTHAGQIARGLKQFESKHPDRAAKVQPLFITVDPERDTPKALAEFTANFHPRLLGLTGTPEQVETMLKTFRIYAQKVPGTTPDSYTFDHLAILYLMDPEGLPVQFIAGQSATPEAVAAMLDQFVA